MTKPLDVGALPELTDQELQTLRNLGNECESAANEITQLRAELEASQKLAADRLEQMQADRAQALVWRGELEASRLECERLRVDAGRWRFAVDMCNVDYDPSEPWQLVIWEPGTSDDWRAILNDAVDAAMKKERT